MTELQKEFEATGYTSWINSDLYPDGKIYTKEYTESLEKQVQSLRIALVVGQSEQLFCPDCNSKARMQNGFIWCENDDCGGIYRVNKLPTTSVYTKH